MDSRDEKNTINSVLIERSLAATAVEILQANVTVAFMFLLECTF